MVIDCLLVSERAPRRDPSRDLSPGCPSPSTVNDNTITCTTSARPAGVFGTPGIVVTVAGKGNAVVAPTLLFSENIHLGRERGCRFKRSWRAEHLPTQHLVALGAT